MAFMEPLIDRLNQAESELMTLRRRTDRLTQTVAEMKKEASLASPEVTRPLRTSPPPIPSMPPVPLPPVERVITPPETAQPGPVTAVQVPVVIPDNSTEQESLADPRNLELQLGRVWSVRLGIVLVTTGLVFLSRYTYDAFVRDLGPGVRLTIMYLLSFGIAGAGLICERWKTTLQSYGRIVAAGGLAAVYYCSFAAHNVAALKVIDHPVWASLLLFVSAGLFCGISLWRDSRVMLSTSLALAFYSVSVNPIGWMSCLSGLVLSAFGIGMMIRHRWAEVGFLVLLGSYLSFFWWQVAVNLEHSTIGHWFLPAFWLLFAAASLSPGRPSEPDRHLLFTSFNNAAFFLLFSFRFETGGWMDKHWLFCFIFGAILMALSFAGRARFPEKSRLVHLVKGASVITLGLALLLDGHQLFVALLLEALVLMILGKRYPSPLPVAGAWGMALLSVFVILNASHSEVPVVTWIFGALGWLALGFIHGWNRDQNEARFDPVSLAASVVSLLFLTFGLMLNWTEWGRVLVLGNLALLGAGLSLLPRVRRHGVEAIGTYLAGGFLAFASLLGLHAPNLAHTFTAGLMALICSIPMAILALKEPQKELREIAHFVSGAFLALFVALAFEFIRKSGLEVPVRLGLYLMIPIAGTLTAMRTKLLAHSVVPFAMHLALIETGGAETGTLFLGFVLISAHFFLIHRWNGLRDREVLREILFFLAAIFWGLFLVSGLESPGVPLVLTSVALFVFAPFFDRVMTALAAVPFFFFGLFFASVAGGTPEVYLSLLAFLSLHLYRTSRENGEPLVIMTTITLVLFWFQLTKDAGNAPLAAVWGSTGTIFLLVGLGLKSRCFRLLGLILLACSLGYLMIFDLVKLNPLPRILSFMTLGLGLLGLGFVYNRWQDRLKQIL
jgi:uncharacterized membrane protein